MAGLSVLLETQETFPKDTHIISKISLKNYTSSLTSSCSTRRSTFLEDCYLCRRRLQHGKDIYMYRGDRAFCSEECRRRQIFMDEEGGKRDNCSLATAASGKHPVGRRGGRATARRRALAGGFAL